MVAGVGLTVVMELEMKGQSNVENIVCIVNLANQKRTTSCLPLSKGNGKTVYAHAMEAFVL